MKQLKKGEAKRLLAVPFLLISMMSSASAQRINVVCRVAPLSQIPLSLKTQARAANATDAEICREVESGRLSYAALTLPRRSENGVCSFLQTGLPFYLNGWTMMAASALPCPEQLSKSYTYTETVSPAEFLLVLNAVRSGINFSPLFPVWTGSKYDEEAFGDFKKARSRKLPLRLSLLIGERHWLFTRLEAHIDDPLQEDRFLKLTFVRFFWGQTILLNANAGIL